MLARSVKGALFLGAFALVPYAGTALAEPPPAAAPSAPVAAAPAPVAPAPAPVAAPLQPATAPHGAVVVAVTDDAGPAARALAHEVYREPTLRPSIDEATARALTGDGATATAPQAGPADKIAEITALRGSIAASVTDITTRHLLASLGASLHADLVVAVTMTNGNAGARVLHTGTASFEDVTFGAGIMIAADGAKTYSWPGVATTLRGLLPAPPAPPPVSEPPKPVAKPIEPVTDEHKKALSDQRPAWKSPWFWAAIGGVAAVGVTVFVLSKTASTTSLVHLDGSVAP